MPIISDPRLNPVVVRAELGGESDEELKELPPGADHFIDTSSNPRPVKSESLIGKGWKGFKSLFTKGAEAIDTAKIKERAADSDPAKGRV